MTFFTHIKIADSGWILEKCASEIAKRSKYITYSLHEDETAQIQYYMNYSAYRKRVSPFELAFFTHSEHDEGARARYFSIAKQMDYRICMSDRYARELSSVTGCDAIQTIAPGIDVNVFKPKVRIGVVGRTYHTGRKGEAIVAQVMDIPGIEWCFTGSGWPGQAAMVKDDAMPDFYNGLDYVLVPSLYEGGPLCVLEGLACGKPIIASDVGWVDKYPHIPFQNGDAGSLREVLERLVAQRNELRESVLQTTWDAWAEGHLELFEQIARNNDARISSVIKAPNDGRKRITDYSIISHGSEGVTRGGPTSRIANIVKTAADVGIEINVLSTQASLNAEASPSSLVHVFNSWPLHTAVNELTLAAKRGSLAVYSPIALNLNYYSYFSKAMTTLLREATDSTQLEQGVNIIHQLTPPYDPEIGVPPPEGVPGHFDALKAGVGLADHVIFLSEYERGFLDSIGAKPKASTVVRNGVDAGTMANGNPALFRNQYGLSDFVLIVGRIETRKNQALVAYALRDTNVPVVCVGHIGDQSYFDLMNRWCGSNFIHIDRIDDRKMLASAYKAASCLVLSSWSEGAPLVALEAAAAGTPLILSNMASEQEYFGDFATYLHPCDLQGIRDAALKAIETPETNERRRERSEMALQKYDISLHASETLAVYEQVMRSGNSTPDRKKYQRQNTVLDNTHFAHQILDGRTLAGVTSVEANLSQALLRVAPETNSIVWNGGSGGYVGSKLSELQTKESVRELFGRPRNSDKSYVGIADVQINVPVKPAPIGPRRAVVSTFKQTLAAFPRPLNVAAVKGIKRFKPNFEPLVRPEHRIFRKPSFAQSVKVSPEFSRVYDPINETLSTGDRLVLLGQPWISNDRMLSDLCDLVRRKRLELWAHVPDIVCVTDSDSFNQRTRTDFRRRLLKLLSVTDTAIVISDQAEMEIKRLIALNGLDVRTKRVLLSINDELRNAQPRRPNRVLPERFVLFVSSMNNRKRHSFITDIWVDLRQELRRAGYHDDIGLIFVGGAQEGYAQYRDPMFLSQLAAENIFVFDGIKSDELAWLYQNCLFSVYPPRVEGWGIPPIESLFFGKPCIVSNTVPSAIETESPALVKIPPADYFGWIDALKTLTVNDSLRTALEQHAKRYTLPEWDKAAEVIFK
ncbi:glycosyltransferase family 4 protein [Brucella pituitosa]|uniref:glycosyltransferase family 4 protein n=1 Tax=Brucella pituitosa TaxID=571256 RepID=UPI003F4A9249